jgi:hypothetical protein
MHRGVSLDATSERGLTKHRRLGLVGAVALALVAALVRHLRADSNGRFALNLPPGIYTVTGLVFGSTTRSLASQPHTKVTVKRGHPVRIRIVSQIL